jgi:uncharacterized SAM-binding protein YcdF (DUF218 family)
LTARSRRLLPWASAVILLALLAVTHTVWLEFLGRLLVRAEAPARADLLVVLAGDFYGLRIIRAGQLLREGFAPRALVSGPEGIYGFHESELAIRFAARHGFAESDFESFPHRETSTRGEAAVIVPELRRRGVRRLLLVTSNFHTRRAGSVFRAAAPDMDIIVVAAPDRDFEPASWWRHREAQKKFLLEWLKTIANLVGY